SIILERLLRRIRRPDLHTRTLGRFDGMAARMRTTPPRSLTVYRQRSDLRKWLARGTGTGSVTIPALHQHRLPWERVVIVNLHAELSPASPILNDVLAMTQRFTRE